MPTSVIYFITESIQRVLPFSLSSRLQCAIEVGISIPNLCIAFQTRKLTAEMILSLFLKVYGTHQAKAGSSSIFLALTYSATSTGLDSFRSFNGTHVWGPYFQSHKNFRPMVVLRCTRLPKFVTNHISFFLAAPLSFECVDIDLRSCE